MTHFGFINQHCPITTNMGLGKPLSCEVVKKKLLEKLCEFCLENVKCYLAVKNITNNVSVFL